MSSVVNETNRLRMNGDTLTPISIFHRLKGDRKFLLESSLKYEESGRYSFIGSNPMKEYRGFGKELLETDLRTKEIKRHIGKSLDVLKTLLVFTEDDDDDFPFTGGAIGYFGYDVIAQYESIGNQLLDDRDMPDIHLLVYETIIVYDHLKQDVTIIHRGTNPSELTNIQKQLEIKEKIEKLDEVLNIIKNEEVPSSDVHRLMKNFEKLSLLKFGIPFKFNPDAYVYNMPKIDHIKQFLDNYEYTSWKYGKTNEEIAEKRKKIENYSNFVNKYFSLFFK